MLAADLRQLRRTVFLIMEKLRTLQLLAFDEYCRFDTSAFFRRIIRASPYTPKESRSIKTAIFIESQEFRLPRGRVNCQTHAHAPRAPCMEKIYGNLRKPVQLSRALALHLFCLNQEHSTCTLCSHSCRSTTRVLNFRI